MITAGGGAMTTRLDRNVVGALGEVLPAQVVITDPDRIASYRTDRAMFCPAGTPAAVVLARSTEQVAATLRTASRLGVPGGPPGARRRAAGAANAIDGCIVLSTEKLDRVLEVDAANRLVVTQPGV